MAKPFCPFGAEKCPKTDELEQDIIYIKAQIINLTKIVYVLVGIIAIQTGVLVW